MTIPVVSCFFGMGNRKFSLSFVWGQRAMTLCNEVIPYPVAVIARLYMLAC